MGQFWIETFINAFPMLLLIAAWVGFMVMWRRGGFQSKYQAAYLEQIRAQVAALERIAAAIEKKP